MDDCSFLLPNYDDSSFVKTKAEDEIVDEHNYSPLILTKYDQVKFVFNKKQKNTYFVGFVKNDSKILISIVYSDENFKKWEKIDKEDKEIEINNYFELNSNEMKIEFCFTSNLLVIVLNHQVCCLDIRSLKKKFKIDLQLTKKIDKMELLGIPNSDCFLLMINKEQLFYFILKKTDETPIIIEKSVNNCVLLLVERNILALVVQNEVENKEELSLLKLTDKAIKLLSTETFEEINHVKYLSITPDCHYLSVFSEKQKLLKLYRINAEKIELLAELPILSIVNCMAANNKYIILGIDDNRILSYLIVDCQNKQHENRIKGLEDE